MIMLVRRHKVAFLIISALGFSLGMSIFTYLSLQGLDDPSKLELKIIAERVLLVGIVGSLALIAGFLIVVRDSYDLGRVFRRLSAMHRMSGDQIQLELRRLGSVGTQIDALYRSISELSERKTSRISGLNALLVLLLRRSEANLLVVSPGGKVYQATTAAIKYFGVTQSEITNLSVDKLIDTETFLETSEAISRIKGRYRINHGHDGIVVLPVINDRGLVAYYVYLLGDDAREDLRHPSRESNTSEEPGSEPSQSGETTSAASATDRRSNSPLLSGWRDNALRTFFSRLTRKH